MDNKNQLNELHKVAAFLTENPDIASMDQSQIVKKLLEVIGDKSQKEDNSVIKKKRGRPKKTQEPKPQPKKRIEDFKVNRDDEIGSEEEQEESDEEEASDKKKQDLRARVSPISKNRPPNKFKPSSYEQESEIRASKKFDEKYVYTAKRAPRTRPPAQRIKIKCRGCGRTEKVFKSHILSVDDSSGFLCNRCSTGRA